MLIDCSPNSDSEISGHGIEYNLVMVDMVEGGLSDASVVTVCYLVFIRVLGAFFVAISILPGSQ